MPGDSDAKKDKSFGWIFCVSGPMLSLAFGPLDTLVKEVMKYTSSYYFKVP